MGTGFSFPLTYLGLAPAGEVSFEGVPFVDVVVPTEGFPCVVVVGCSESLASLGVMHMNGAIAASVPV